MNRVMEWRPLVAEVLGIPVDRVSLSESFVALGGTSLQAIGLVSQGQRRLGLDLDIARVLATGPLADALAAAVAYVETAPLPTDPSRGPVHRALLPGQKAMLAAHVLGRDQPYHLMFTLEAPEPLEAGRTRDALRALAGRHESLRTMFVQDPPSRVVLPAPHQPRLLHQALPDSDDTVRVVHDLYGRDAARLLRPFEAPPVVFVHTRAGDRSLLTLLAHHTVIDGWSIGVLWRDFVDLYQGGAAGDGPSPEWIRSRLAAAESSGGLHRALRRVAARLDGAATAIALPTDLPPVAEADGRGARLMFHLSPEATAAAGTLATRCRATVTAVLMSAWALAVARRTGRDDLVLGVPASGRFEAGMEGIVGLCTRVVPVRCHAADNMSIVDYLHGATAALAEAVADADLPFEQVVSRLNLATDPGHNPLAQIGFAAHHELVPDSLAGSWRIHEGYCHGAVFDALLYLQSWSSRPRLALEYATSVLTAADAGELVESFQAVLVELAADPDAALAGVTALSRGQARRLRELGDGEKFDTAENIWSRFERQAELTPDAPAITDVAAGITLTYRELRGRALAQAALLHGCGVRAGDRVALEMARSAAEAAAVLGILRLGASYVAVDQSATAEWRAHLVAAATPRARIGDTPAGDPIWTSVVECPVASAGDANVELPAHVAGSARPAYVAFTSGSTGVPKGVVVPHRAVLRLAADFVVESVAPSGSSMLRLAPLAFDASTLELLVPLTNGHAVTVYPPGEVTPHDLTEFLRANPVSHAWLTSGLFHLVADHRPDAFRGLRQLFTGGGVVSPAHVRRVLEHCPGLRVTNGYGPTENTTFTTTFDVDGPHEVLDPLPIGIPVCGTRLHVVDPAGRAVPPGAVGELRTAGWGLADGYLGDAERTAESFVRSAGSGTRMYRTGDLVRWGADGFLRFLGRNDRQVKIAGHRVELVDVERRIRAVPGVLDAVVFLASDGPVSRLCAAVKAGTPAAVLRQAVEPELASYARPQHWFTVEEFPLDRNGKVDLCALGTLARTSTAAEQPAPAAVAIVSLTDLEELISDAWSEALGTDDFDLDEAFFDVGGDSLSLAMARKLIQGRLGRQLPLTDMYRFPTVQALATHLHAFMAGAAA